MKVNREFNGSVLAAAVGSAEGDPLGFGVTA